MRAIDGDKIVLDYSGLAYISPTDCRAITEYFAKQIRAMPTITPERKRGRWKQDENLRAVCSECGESCATYVLGAPRDRFCKMCGAKMGEGD